MTTRKKDPNEFRRKAARKNEKAQEIAKAAETRNLTEDEKEQIDALRGEADRLVDRAETLEETERRQLGVMNRPGQSVGANMPITNSPRSTSTTSENRTRYESGDTCELRGDMTASEWVRNKPDRDPEKQEVFEEVGLGSFLRALAEGPQNDMEKRALEISTNTAGGHLVDEFLVANVLDALVAESVIFGPNGAGVRRIMMEDQPADVINFARTDSVPSAVWHTEGTSESSQDPTFSRATADINTLLIPTFVSRELLQDAQNLEQALERIMVQSANEEIMSAALGVSGTSGAPNGLQDDGSRQTVSASGAFDYDELLDLVQAIMDADGPIPTDAIWAPRTAIDAAKLKDGQANPLTLPPIVSDMTFHNGGSSIPTDQGTGNDESSVFVGGFSNMGVVFRTDGIMIESSREARLDSYEVIFMLHARLDPVILRPAALGEYDSITS